MSDQKPIDIYAESLGRAGGEPVEGTLFGHDVLIRRNFTADEVAQYISFFGPEAAEKPMNDQNTKILSHLLDDSAEVIDDLVAKLADVSIIAMQSILLKIGQIAGLRGETGNFLTGTLN